MIATTRKLQVKSIMGATSPEIPVAEGLKFRIATSFDDVADLRERWDALVESVGADIYMTFDWCRTWWEFYGDGRALFLFLISNNEHLVGILPMFVERVWLGPVWLRIAKLVGSDHALTLCDPPLVPETARSAFHIVVERLITTGGVDVVTFGPLSGNRWVGLQWDSIGKSHAVLIASQGSRDYHTAFYLPSSMEAYWKSFPSRERANFKRRIRQFESKGIVTFRSVRDPHQCIEMFEKFREMHELQWSFANKLGHFQDWPRSLEFNRTLIRRLSPSGRALMQQITVGDEPVAYQYGYRLGTREYWRFPARIVTGEWGRISLGNVAMFKQIEYAINDGVTYVDSGLGRYDYKTAAGGKEYPAGHVRFVAKKRVAQWRLSVFACLSRSLDLAYYRIWFLKVAPKLPFRRTPLNRLWIRSRL